ncbi:unnamed protein product [Didymodactylos carnosus]|uniref:Uncharacterized protein n=1 Tax=Didymodactylos carnosus TaxID=1234261 RepID=A0A814UQW8_9BILA|nr:unnamed protein product [Didymodactylos carnosus]CAF1178322.1 unnamed protein product [Didymodactylos carnosus]CAF3789806.1 unnamed protein product [Didymodactylos carnosus]CAF3942523.1 unnamed protein product [Didymodactylos carnosus]
MGDRRLNIGYKRNLTSSKSPASILQLEEMVQDLQERNDYLNYKTNDLEQYQRRCAFRIYGIAENKEEDTNAILKDIGKVMGVKVKDNDIYASHRLGKRKNRAIIVRFVRYSVKEYFYKIRTKLKSSEQYKNVYVNEDMSSHNHFIYMCARAKLDKRYVFSKNGCVYYQSISGDFHVLTPVECVDALIGQ